MLAAALIAGGVGPTESRITALKIEGVNGTPGPPDKRCCKGVRDT